MLEQIARSISPSGEYFYLTLPCIALTPAYPPRTMLVTFLLPTPDPLFVMTALLRSPLYLMLSALLLTTIGCASNQSQQTPAVVTPQRWHAPLPHAGNTSQLINWWGQFNDPKLNSLLSKAEAASPSLAVAFANIQAARANLASNESSLWPQLTATGAATRSKNSIGSTSGTGGIVTTTTAGLDASWEIDLFGKLRSSNDAAKAKLAARVNDWHDARISLAAEVADTYVQYRACQLLTDAYREENDSQQETARVTRLSVNAGFTAPADDALANASAASTHAQMVSQQASCDVLVKSLVALVGEDEPELRQLLGAAAPVDTKGKTIPTPASINVAAVPADLLRQRPDLAASERELAATIASVGAAEADRYPSLSLTGSISRMHTDTGISLTPWSIGPSISLPLFDAGKRRAAVDSAAASRDAALATYQQAVRDAVKEVEQALVRLDSAAHRNQDAVISAEGYRRYFEATDLSWKAGSSSLLTREEARRSALTADINRITLQLENVQQWIALYKALGGGWNSDNLVSGPATPAPTPNLSGEAQ